MGRSSSLMDPDGSSLKGKSWGDRTIGIRLDILSNGCFGLVLSVYITSTDVCLVFPPNQNSPGGSARAARVN